eukprot:s1687_g11.t1
MLGCVTGLYAGGSTACSCVSRSCGLAALRHATFCCVHLRLRIYAVLRCVTLCNVYAVARLRHAPLRNMVLRSCMLAVLHHATLCDMFAGFRVYPMLRYVRLHMRIYVMPHAMLAPLFNVLAGSRRYGSLRSATFRFACGSRPRYVV